MAYVDDKAAQAKNLVGKRIEIPVHYDMWMRGARFGVVTKSGKAKKWSTLHLCPA